VTRMTTASVIVSSYNYAPYLRAAIDSALSQTYAHTEVVVVDDGSSDDSPQIVRGYGERVVAVLKDNAGQASSLSAGFDASRGDVVIFLDSDDVLEPHAVARAVEAMAGGVSKVHWPLREIDTDGRPLGNLVPRAELSGGDLRRAVLEDGPRSDGYVWPPTSGNAWSRGFLRQVMPIPQFYRTCPDLYLCAVAPLYGAVVALPTPLSRWRVHGENNTWKGRFLERLDDYVELWERACDDLERHARHLGLEPQPRRWREQSWWHRLRRAARRVDELLPPGEPFVLIDDDQWGCAEVGGRTAVPLVRAGGAPADDAHAVRELANRRAEGVRYLILAWPAFWWTDYYRGLADHILSTSLRLADDGDVVAFALDAGGEPDRWPIRKSPSPS